MTPPTDGKLLQGEPAAVQPGRIEEELREIWREAASHQNGSVSRACLLTLVGLAGNGDVQGEVEAALDMASQRMPSRTVLLVACPDDADGIKATINTNFYKHGNDGTRQLYSEEIHLEAGGPAVHRLGSMVQSLRVTDVPAVMYWPGEAPLVNDPCLNVLDAVDRLIVDSRDYRDARDLVAIHRLTAGRVALGDLTWQRLFPWRTLVAHLFDGPPFAEYVRTLDRVTLTLSGPHPAGAYLMAGWLVSRLGWQRPLRWECEDDGEAWHLTRPDGQPVVLTIRNAPGFHQGLARVSLESSRHHAPISMVIERGARLFKLRGTGLPARSRTVSEIPDEELLVQALRSPEEDFVITQALAATDALLSAQEAR